MRWKPKKPVAKEAFKPRTVLTPFEQAMKDLGLTRSDILSHKEYPDKFVFVTTNGQKLFWPKKEK